ncbi:MAG: S41 family peptidase [Gemmatimonadota bacterium]
MRLSASRRGAAGSTSASSWAPRPFLAALLLALFGTVPVPAQELPASPAPAGSGAGTAERGAGAYVADFDMLWEAVRRDYAYWDVSATDWGRARDLYRPRAQAASSRTELAEVVAGLLGELYDAQARLRSDSPSRAGRAEDTRDVWVEWQDGRAIITQVREGSAADRADVEPGMELLAVNGVPIEQARSGRAPESLSRPEPAALGAALRALVADASQGGRTLEVRTPRRKQSTIRLEAGEPALGPGVAAVTWETLPSGFGYMVVRQMDSLEVVAQFDAGLERLRGVPGLVLDLRQLPDGGLDAVARGILSRFVETERGYMRRSAPAGKLWPELDRRVIELVRPRGGTPWTAPVVVLVGRWTAGAAEDVAIGFDALEAGTLVGTPMAGRRGDAGALTLPSSGIRVEFPIVKALHLDGTPREDVVPEVVVDVSAESARNDDDPVLDAGLETLRRLTGS